MAGVQAALIVTLRIAKHHDVLWPMTVMAVLSAALLAAGVLRHYWDIWIHRTVRGISFIFVAIDAGGDLFSLISILFQPTLDVKGMVIYATELTLWLGVFACGGYFNLLPYVQRKLETRRSNRRQASQPQPAIQAPACVQGITLHDMPSSTSVFRTPSSELAVARSRTSASRGDYAGDDDISA
jgi:hypothetical protein